MTSNRVRRDEIDFRIDNIVASLEMEGFHVTDEDRELARRCAEGELTYDEAVLEIIGEHLRADGGSDVDP